MTLSESSLEKLSTCDVRLQELFKKVAEVYPCQVTEGFRDEERQNIAFSQGFSKEQWPNGKHNQNPSKAVDVVPFNDDGKIDYKDMKRIYHFIGFVLGTAFVLGLKVRSGSDWKMDNKLERQIFYDLVHFEIIDE